MSDQAEIDRIRRAYAERDAAPPSVYRWANPGYAFHMQELEWQVLAALRRAGVTLEGAAVLEVGCGSGAVLDRLSQFGAARAAGVDLSPERIAAARRRNPRLEVEVANAAALPFDDGSFDVVCQFVCLSSVLDAGVRRAICADMRRVARPGGLLLSYDIRPTPPLVQRAGRLYGRLRGLDAAAVDAGTPTVPISAGELRTSFPGAELRTVSLNFELAALAGRSRALARALQAVPALRTHTLALARA